MNRRILQNGRRRYPPEETIRRIVSIAQSCGMAVRLIEVSAAGDIRVSDVGEVASSDEFERWEQRL